MTTTFDPETIAGLQKYLSTRAFSYLTSILQPITTNSNLITSGNKRKLERQISINDNPSLSSCRHSVLCQKIVQKVTLGVESSSGTPNLSLKIEHIFRSSRGTVTRTNLKQSQNVFETLIGKIDSSNKKEKITKRGADKPEGRRQLSEVLSNPLYIVYNPLGRVKTEEDLALEIISQSITKFNTWIQKLEGEKMSGDADDLFEILRLELEIPEPEQILEIQKILKI